MMTAWIDQTIGATPADRAKQKNALFLVLTKMDREFEQKAGETEESRKLRWSARLNNSLVNNFRGEWPANWDGKPFDNTFWLRNPTVHRRAADGLRRRPRAAASPRPSPSARSELRGHFVDNAEVRRHFADPARAWDEAFKANDGGVSYLVKSLIPVCDPAIKRAQVRGQLEVQIHRLVDRLAGFHSAADGDSRAKKRDLVHTVLRGLASCIQQQLFGELMAALQIADSALREIYFRIATARPSDEANGRNGKPPAPGLAVDRRRRRSRRDLRRRLRRGARPLARRRRACWRTAPSASPARPPTTGWRTCGASAPTRRRCRISASTASISAG